MDKFEAIAAFIGYLVMAYGAGYPLEWAVNGALGRFGRRMDKIGLWFYQMNAEMDEKNGPLKMPWSK